jgi:signal transduction histidine kinase
MADRSSEINARFRKKAGLIPNRAILISVGLVCLGLLGSAVYNFSTLLRLHTLYLSNRGNEIALSIDSQARGAGRRNNPEFWQSLLEEKYAVCSDTVAFLALVDRQGSILAAAGNPPFGPADKNGSGTEGVYSFEEALEGPRNARREESPHTAGWRIRIGLYTSDAEFIRRQAWIQLCVSAAAISVLIVISLYLIRTLNRFLELKARESSEAHLRSLGVMAASLAHEIRNPLGSMKGLTQLVQEELPRGDHGAQGHLSTVVSEAERLERLVTDLLDFARPRDPEIGVFDLRGLISDIRAILQPGFVASGVTLQWDDAGEQEMIRSDAGGLRQVLLNVLGNALAATPEGGAVTVRMLPRGNDGMTTIEVDDTGHGLRGRDPEELFQPFVTTGTQGTGLGLAISRRIIESLGGFITLEENPGGGTRCTIRLRQAGGSASMI